MVDVEEKTLRSGETVSIHVTAQATDRERWEVSCWDIDGNNRWTKDYIGPSAEDDARAEFDRWQ